MVTRFKSRLSTNNIIFLKAKNITWPCAPLPFNRCNFCLLRNLRKVSSTSILRARWLNQDLPDHLISPYFGWRFSSQHADPCCCQSLCLHMQLSRLIKFMHEDNLYFVQMGSNKHKHKNSVYLLNLIMFIITSILTKCSFTKYLLVTIHKERIWYHRVPVGKV